MSPIRLVRRSWFIVCALCVPVLAVSQGDGRAAAISPAAPTFNALFGARNPRVCAKVTHVPSAGEAAIMVQCDYEAGSRTSGAQPTFFLTTNVKVELGSPKAYNPNVDGWDNIDPSAQVYPLRGSAVGYTCGLVRGSPPGTNCLKSYGDTGQLGQGACWHTQFNEWGCSMTVGGPERDLQARGPTTF